MSQETSSWLNSMCLIGFTDQRGHAWHYRQSDQGTEPNHYPGAIPVEDVRRRLFNWRPVEIVPRLSSSFFSDGLIIDTLDEEHKAIVHPVTGKVFQYASKDYRIHDYNEWLLDTVADILDDDLQIGTAGLLRDGGAAWVQIEMEDTTTTPEGEEFRAFLAAATSLDGSMATRFKRGITRIVCDNTCSVFFDYEQNTADLRVRHTRNSIGQLSKARDALDVVFNAADAYADQVTRLCQRDVDSRQWQRFLTEYAPDFPHYTARERSNASVRRNELDALYQSDPRVSPWTGTAFGVVQAVNTYVQHIQRTRGRSQAERNATNMLYGGIDRVDATTMRILDKVQS